MNTTDRELLELAAKAVGFDYDKTINDEYGNLYGRFVDESKQRIYAWNPRTSDGDALRLAVKLFDANEMAKIWNSVGGLQAGTKWDFDPCAVIRHEIVRAAAMRTVNVDSDGWIENGKYSLVPPRGTIVEVKYRDGQTVGPVPALMNTSSQRDAGPAFWEHDGLDNDIIAYRVVDGEGEMKCVS